MKVGRGVIKKRKDKNNKENITYLGTLPFEEDEEVVIIKTSDLRQSSESQIEFILGCPVEMDEVFWDPEYIKAIENCEECLCFPDELNYEAKDGTKQKLILERKFYSPNPRDYIIVRYVSVDQAVVEGDLFETQIPD